MVTTAGVLTRPEPSPMFSMRTGLPWSKDISKVLNILGHFWINRKSKPICSNGTIYLQLHSGKPTEQWEMNPLKMYFLLKLGIFLCYLSLQEGKGKLLNSW